MVIDSPSLVAQSAVPIDAPRDVLVHAAYLAAPPTIGLLNRGLRGVIAVDAGIGRNDFGGGRSGAGGQRPRAGRRDQRLQRRDVRRAVGVGRRGGQPRQRDCGGAGCAAGLSTRQPRR